MKIEDQNKNTKVKITYTLPISQVPGELDKRSRELGVKMQKIVSLLEHVRFQEDPDASITFLSSIQEDLESMSYSASDLCAIAEGFMHIKTNSAQQLDTYLEGALPEGSLLTEEKSPGDDES